MIKEYKSMDERFIDGFKEIIKRGKQMVKKDILKRLDKQKSEIERL